MNSPNDPTETPGDRNTARPQYGVRIPESAHQGPPSAQRRPAPEERSVSPKAARRMGRGLSFTVILLGALVGLGLMAIGVSEGWIVGLTLTLLGVVGYVMVQFQIIPLFRDPHAVALRRHSKLWLIPGFLLALGLATVGASFLVEPLMGDAIQEGLLDDYILAFIVAGMTMVVGAGLGFGLVAAAMLTHPDDDDSPLRPTDYAERLRERDRGERGGRSDYYDSDWIRRGPSE